MRFMNQWDVEDARARYAEHPVLGPATTTLHNLMTWTNAHSDGWAYWPKPTRAAAKLMELIERDGTTQYRRDERPDVTEDEYKLALRPIKTFRTKHSADFEIIEVGEPEPEPPAPVNDVDVSVIQTHYEHPAVNIKIHGVRADMERLLPLDLGSVKDEGDSEFRTITTPEGFTFDWIDKHIPEAEQNGWWDLTCSDNFEQAKELAKETFGEHVEVYTQGRSGGWLVVHGLPEEIEEWDQALVDKWVEFAKQVRAIADDVPRSWLWMLHANVYEPWEEAQDEPATYTLTITTTNPDLADRIKRAFDQVGIDRSNAGALHKLEAELVRGDGDLLWGTVFEPDEENKDE